MERSASRSVIGWLGCWTASGLSSRDEAKARCDTRPCRPAKACRALVSLTRPSQAAARHRATSLAATTRRAAWPSLRFLQPSVTASSTSRSQRHDVAPRLA